MCVYTHTCAKVDHEFGKVESPASVHTWLVSGRRRALAYVASSCERHPRVKSGFGEVVTEGLVCAMQCF